MWFTGRDMKEKTRMELSKELDSAYGMEEALPLVLDAVAAFQKIGDHFANNALKHAPNKDPERSDEILKKMEELCDLLYPMEKQIMSLYGKFQPRTCIWTNGGISKPEDVSKPAAALEDLEEWKNFIEGEK